ncbi:prolyl oligopeptidase family serine peptidase [bacterium]|nr:prolyl oligopeptidase family serine peptidase [bacterium]
MHTKYLIPLMLVLLSIATISSAAEIKIDNWLVTSAVSMPIATLDDENTMGAGQFLDSPPIDPYKFFPFKGKEVQFTPHSSTRFSQIAKSQFSFDVLPGVGEETVHLAYAATYLNVPTWQKTTVKVSSRAPFRMFVEEEEKLKISSAAKSDTTYEAKDILLDQGLRRILIVTAISGTDSLDEWTFEVTLDNGEGEISDLPTSTIDPRHPFNIDDYYLQDGVGGLELTKDGNFLAIKFTNWNRKEDKRESHLEVWNLDGRKKEKIWEYHHPKGVGSFNWSPDGNKLLMSLPAETGNDLYLWHRATQKMERIVHAIERSAGFQWSPDSKSIYYTRTVPHEEDESKVYKVMWGLEDRWGGWRDDTEIYYFTLEGNAHAKLTSGMYDPGSFNISPDGSFLLMTRYVSQPERPFYVCEFWKISTHTGEAEKVQTFNSYSVGHVTMSPDGKFIAFDAPMDPVGEEFPDHNDNATDLWTMEIATGEMKNHTRNFEPAIAMFAYGTGRDGTLFWHEDGTIGFTGLYKKEVKLYTYDPKNEGVIQKTDLPTPGASHFRAATAKKANMCVFRGDDVTAPGDVYWFDAGRKRGEVLIDMNQEFDRLIGPAPRIEDYNYVNSDGVEIPGYLYYPQGYDPAKSYPMIVDYYGGVFGYGDGFIWMSQVLANRGYFVYVPSPRGAAGWGQEFADSHPNDWGTRVSRDMNEGVRHIVANVEGVDGARVAPVSGSYGGFLAMYLLSQPKDHPDHYPYATAISDYGISNLASYWGIGWWGYLYSDMATARNYPWNAKQYYIDHSPLFFADNITVPLLLLHGDSDVNVPVGESDQMYTALKVLNREVEFIRFPGEDHGMVGKRSTYLTSKRMHFEWFDNYLRNLPGAWEARMEGEKKK